MTKTADDSSIWVRLGLNLLARNAVSGTIVNRVPSDVAGRKSNGKYQIRGAEEMKMMWVKRGVTFLVFALFLPAVIFAETVGVFYDSAVPQIVFAAEDVKTALETKGFAVEMRSLSNLSGSYAHKKVVIALASNTSVTAVLAGQGGASLPGLGEQAYALRTTATPQSSYWALGGDAAGSMYAGLDVAECIRLYLFESEVGGDHSPYIDHRGIKYHLDLDARSPSYSGAGTSAQESIEYNWDMAYWHDYLDTMARQRYNTVFFWSLNPFPSMVRVPEYPNAALENVYRTTALLYPDGRGKDMSNSESLANLELVKAITVDEKIAFWREVMQYAADRGIGFYYQTWNTYTYGTETSYPELKNFESEVNTDYFFQTAKAFLETYPLVKGLGAYPGEKMLDLDSDQEKQDWMFDTYGKAINAVLAEDPGRDLEYVAGKGTKYADEIDQAFEGKINCSYNYDVKYTRSKMISVVDTGELDGVTPSGGRKFWLLCRDDDNYMFRWGDPDYMKAFFENMPVSIVTGVELGANLVTYGRESGEKNPFVPRQVFLQKHWFKSMLFGRCAYDPTIPVKRFKDMVAERYPQIPGQSLVEAWVAASKIRPLVNSFNYKGNENDYTFVMENCYSRETNAGYKEDFTGFVPIKHLAEARPHSNSGMTSISEYLSGNQSGITPPQLAQKLDDYARQALTLGMNGVADKETRKIIGDIYCMAHLGHYYADKIRAALHVESGDQTAAWQDAANAASHWRDYAALVDQYYDPVRLSRMLDPTKNTDDGYVNIPKLQEQADLDYIDIGGSNNQPPLITSTPSRKVDVSVPYSYTMTASDSEGDSVTFSKVMIPEWLQFNAGNGLLSGMPSAGDIGSHKVTLRSHDAGGFLEQTFTIVVGDRTLK
jgi:hypothetical protein